MASAYLIIFFTLLPSCGSKFSIFQFGLQLTLMEADVCGTTIFTEAKDSSQLSKIPIPIAMLVPQTLAENPNYDTLSFLQELKLSHILNPTLFGTLKFARNCATVLVSGKDDFELAWKVEILLTRRFSRPHKDYFFFHFEFVPSDLDFKVKFRHLRYKHLILPWNNSDSPEIVGYCGVNLPLFSHLCPWCINGEKLELAASNTPALFRPATKSKPPRGTLASAFKEIDLRYNSSTYIRLSSFNGSAGMRLNNGTGDWRGTVGDVFNRHVNFSIATGMTKERFFFVDFSATHMWNERVFFIRSPPVRAGWLTIFRPLTRNLWLLTGVTLFFALLPAMYVLAIVQDGFRTNLPWWNSHLLFRVMDTIWCVVLEQTTFTRVWRGNRVRLLIMLWSAVCVVVATGYKSKLMNFLTFLDREDVPLTHLELSLSDYALFFRNYKGIVILETRQSTNPMHKRFMARASFPEHSFECFTSALTTPRSACMDFILNGEYTIAVNTTLRRTGNAHIFVRSKDKDIKWMIMWIFPKSSPLTATFDRVKLQLLACGHFEWWMKEDWGKKKYAGLRWLESQKESKIKKTIEELLDDLGQSGGSLQRENVMSIFLIWEMGLVLGGLVWIVENVVHIPWARVWMEAVGVLTNLCQRRTIAEY